MEIGDISSEAGSNVGKCSTWYTGIVQVSIGVLPSEGVLLKCPSAAGQSEK